MKYLLAVILLYTIVLGCSEKNDAALLKQKYLQLRPLLAVADSMGFNTKAALLLAVIKLTQPDTTIPDKRGAVERPVMQSAGNDSAFQKEFLQLAMLRINSPAMSNGTVTLVDTSNKYVLGYICKKNKEKLLIVLNMDEDNQALHYETDYPNMEIMYCNYDIVAPGPVTSSLALRPYEARILKME